MQDGKIKRIGILTSGGDAPGMNAAVRAATRSALANGVEVMGIYKGYRGLIDSDLKLFSARDVSNIIGKGGTILYSDRCDEFKTDAGMEKAVKTCKDNKIDGIVAIGGDGTFRGATDLSRLGIPTIGIPATIDNDISVTEYSIGFDTAMNTVVEWVDKLRDTCESHARCNVVEVMGRDAGHIALECGIATGASGIAISERNFDQEICLQNLIDCRKQGKRSFIIIISEGMGKTYAEDFAVKINEQTKIDTKFARLAHVQRGGNPSLRDRFIASRMGDEAVSLLLDGKKNLVVCMQKNNITSVDIEFSFKFDKFYKGKMKKEDFIMLNDETKKQFEIQAKLKNDRIDYLYNLSLKISK